MIATKIVKRSFKIKGSMPNIHKDMIQAKVDTRFVLSNAVKSVVGFRRSCKGGVRERGKERKEMRPKMRTGVRGRGTTISNGIWVRIPVSSEKVNRSIKRGIRGKAVEKMAAWGTSSWGVNVDDCVFLPLETES
jgi:hypothetical protein